MIKVALRRSLSLFCCEEKSNKEQLKGRVVQYGVLEACFGQLSDFVLLKAYFVLRMAFASANTHTGILVSFYLILSPLFRYNE